MDQEEPRSSCAGADRENLSEPRRVQKPAVLRDADQSRAETPRAKKDAGPPGEPELIGQVLTDVLRHIGFRVQLELEKRADGYHVNILSWQSLGLLIGHRGSTLRALQHLVRLIVRKTYSDVPTVSIDVGGYRVRRESFLRRKATAVARIVVETNREMAFDILTERETELIREVLYAESGVRVHTVGTGARRTVVIVPSRGLT